MVKSVRGVRPPWVSRMLWSMLVTFALVGVVGVADVMRRPGPPNWCRLLPVPFGLRTNCEVNAAIEAFARSPAEGTARIEFAVDGQLNRDYVWLQTVVTVESCEAYCDRILHRLLRQSCRLVIARPWKHAPLTSRCEVG